MPTDPWGILAAVDAIRAEQAAQRRLIEQLLAQGDADPLLPFHEIRSCSPPTAWAWLGRHPEVKALGIPVGRRLLFRRREVEAFLRQRREGRAA